MKMQLGELAKLINGKLIGDDSVHITGVGDIESAVSGQISFMKNNSYLKKAQKSKASALIVPTDTEGIKTPIIESVDPYHSFIKILDLISKEKMVFPPGVHKTVVSGKNAKLGIDISIAPYVVLSDDVFIGDQTVLGANCTVGNKVSIGKNCLIYPNVSIGDDTVIGNNVIIHSGTVIGSDGCGFIPYEGGLKKVPQIGSVIIEDDVEIGSNCTIDRATMNVTKICKGVKFDNQVHIAHNVIIGDYSIILAHCTIAGSTKIGKHCIFSGQVGAVDNITIGDNVIVGEKAAVTKNITDNSVLWGNPAQAMNDEKKVIVLSRKLPEMYAEIKKLNEKIIELESGLEKQSG
ncbi:UDP-3-O-(3-hydroxymyristoyl)glucosamine N-acyltransferase [Bacteroidota bacterium]